MIEILISEVGFKKALGDLREKDEEKIKKEEFLKETMGIGTDTDTSTRGSNEGPEKVQQEAEAPDYIRIMRCPSASDDPNAICGQCKHFGVHKEIVGEDEYSCSDTCHGTGVACEEMGREYLDAVEDEPCCEAHPDDCCNKDGCDGYLEKLDRADPDDLPEHLDTNSDLFKQMQRRRMQALSAIHKEMQYLFTSKYLKDKDKYGDDWYLLINSLLAQLHYHEVQGHDDRVKELLRQIASTAATAMTHLGIRKR